MNTEIIDRYLSGEMEETEKNEFERSLSAEDPSYKGNNITLQNEMDLQKEIIYAIKERGLREQLQRKEQELRARRQRVKLLSLWSVSGTGGLAIAAAVAAMLTIAPLAKTMQQYSADYVESVDASAAYRGEADEAQLRLDEAFLLMQEGNWEEARQIARTYLDIEATTEQQLEQREEAQWIEALCLMHNGRTGKAIRLLRQIAEGEGYYSQQAKNALESFGKE